MINCLGENWRILTREEIGKPEAYILDVTAGNRHIHAPGNKYSNRIIFLDKEPKLLIKPDVLATWDRLPFDDRYFDDGCVIFDPPHMHRYDADKERCQWIHKYPGENGPIKAGYWGFFKTRKQMMSDIWRAQREFSRVTRRLCFKWCDVEVSLNKILTLFSDWDKIFVQEYYSRMKRGRNRMFWVKMVRKEKLLGRGGGDLISFLGDLDPDRESIVKKATSSPILVNGPDETETLLVLAPDVVQGRVTVPRVSVPSV
jgi:hypothetical protein